MGRERGSDDHAVERARREVRQTRAHGLPALCSLCAIPDAAAASVPGCGTPVGEITYDPVHRKLIDSKYSYRLCMYTLR
jgi:hypothetical protein